MSENQDKEALPIDMQRRRFLLKATGVVGAIGSICALKPFVASLLPTGKVQAAAAPLEVDISSLQPGQQMTVNWRGKPIWIIRRTAEMLAHLSDSVADLRDPLSLVPQQPYYAQNAYRSINPEYLVLVGVCTHLGCTPKYTPKAKAGFHCPCHGSTFDLAGRVFKGVPAPVNMEVPDYHFKTNTLIVIGQNAP